MMNTKIKSDNIYKIFGDETDIALDMLDSGKSKSEILQETGQTIAVDNASFEVKEGEVFVVMGLSGSGKSTLVRMINGLIPPTRGTMLVESIDVATCSPEKLREIRRDLVAMVFQHFALFPHRTVAENVAYGLKIKGIAAAERREKARNALGQVGLAAYANSYPEELSGGMQQRVGLARGLATDPQILLMDEPFSALDPLIRRDMQSELIELQRSLKKTIVFITHDLNEALTLGDKIAIMKDGRFVQIGTAEEIVGAPADQYVAAFTRDIDRSRVFNVDSIAIEAKPIDLASATSEEALQQMEVLERDALFVLEDGAIAGLVTYRDLAKASKDGNADIRRQLRQDYQTIGAQANLHELYEKSTEGLPVAVVENNRLVGIVEQKAIFAQLVRGEGQSATSANERMVTA
jgi:glycine betaine/proline transport system ATP-binding protein